MRTIRMTVAAALLLALTASAEETFRVEVDPAVYPEKAFAGKDVKASSIPGRVKRPDAIPDKKEREAAFDAVPGLEKDVANLDELDRDLLFVRARTKQLKELRKIYPGITEKKLSSLQDFLQKAARRDTAK
jgi:hypothetical protein